MSLLSLIFWLATLAVIHVEYALAQVGDMEPPAAEVKGWAHLALSWIKASIPWKAWYMRVLVLSKRDVTFLSWVMDRTIARGLKKLHPSLIILKSR